MVVGAMKSSFTICIHIDDKAIYRFSGKMDEQKMIESANHIEQILIQNGAKLDKIQNVFELFIETVQNMLSYAHNSVALNNQKREVICHFSLAYFTEENNYILESCNLINTAQQAEIEQRVAALKDLDDATLRKLIRQKSRTREDCHERGAGLGYILMARRSSSPIEIAFVPYEHGILEYRQRLTI